MPAVLFWKRPGIKIADVAHVGLYWKPWFAAQSHASFEGRNDLARYVKARVDRGVAQVGEVIWGCSDIPN